MAKEGARYQGAGLRSRAVNGKGSEESTKNLSRRNPLQYLHCIMIVFWAGDKKISRRCISACQPRFGLKDHEHSHTDPSTAVRSVYSGGFSWYIHAESHLSRHCCQHQLICRAEGSAVYVRHLPTREVTEMRNLRGKAYD